MKYAGKLRSPYVKEFLRKWSAIWARTLKNVPQPCSRPKKFKEYRLNWRPDVSGRPWGKNFNSLTWIALVLLPQTFEMQSCWNSSWWELKAIINTGYPETALEFQKSLKTRVYETGDSLFKAVKRRWQHQGTRPGATFCGIPTGHETPLMLTVNTIRSTLIPPPTQMQIELRCLCQCRLHSMSAKTCRNKSCPTENRPTHSYIFFS